MPTPRNIPPNTDLCSLAFAPNDQLLFTPGAHYYTSRQLNLHTPGLQFLGNHALLALNPDVGGSTNILIAAPAIRFEQLTVTKANTAFTIIAPDATLDRLTITTATVNAIKTDDGGDDLTVTDCVIATTGSASIFIASHRVNIVRSSFAGSQREYAARWDLSTRRIKPNGARVSQSSFATHNNAHKQCFGARMLDNLRIDTSSFDGSTRWGQTPPQGQPPITNPTECNSDNRVTACTFTHPDLSSAATIHSGSTVTLDTCIFLPPVNLYPASSVDVGSILDIRNSIQQITVATQPKHIVAQSSKGKWTATNNVVQFVP